MLVALVLVSVLVVYWGTSDYRRELECSRFSDYRGEKIGCGTAGSGYIGIIDGIKADGDYGYTWVWFAGKSGKTVKQKGQLGWGKISLVKKTNDIAKGESIDDRYEMVNSREGAGRLTDGQEVIVDVYEDIGKCSDKTARYFKQYLVKQDIISLLQLKMQSYLCPLAISQVYY